MSERLGRSTAIAKKGDNMKRFVGIIAALMAAVTCLSLAACAPSPAEEALSMVDSGDMAGAVSKAMEISDDAERADVLDRIAIEAMRPQDVLDYATLGISDLTSYIDTFANEFISEVLSAAFSGGSASPEVDTSNADYVAALESGDKVREIFQEYKEIVSPEVQECLSDEVRDLDARYREICSDTGGLLSASGILDYLYSKEVLGEIAAQEASIDPKELANNVERFELDYEKATSANN